MADDPVSPSASDTSVDQAPQPPVQPEPASDLSAPASESANTQPVQDQTEAPPTPEPAQAPETPPVEPVSMSTSPQTEPPISTPSAQVVPPEVAPVTEEIPTVQRIVEPQAQPSIPPLHYPYYMSYPVTFDFGAQPTDEDMKKKYDAWGIVGHNGIDFGLPEGTEVLSCDEGTVIQVGDNGDFGISITIKHSWGTSIYCHLQSFGVLVNDHISKAQVIGSSDHTGYAIGPHLHFGIQPNNPDVNNGYLGYINPSPYLSETSEKPQPKTPPDLSAEKPTEETPVVRPVVPESPPSPLPSEASAKEGQPNTSSDDIQKQAVAMFDARVKENSFKGNQAKKEKHSAALQKLFAFTQEKKKITNEQARDLLHISQSSATNYLTELVTRGMLKTEGKGKATVYLF